MAIFALILKFAGSITVGLILIHSRRLPKDERDALNYVRKICDGQLSRQQVLRLLGAAGLMCLLPSARFISSANAIPIPWLVRNVTVTQKEVRKQDQIPAEITLSNPAPEPQRARVLLEYKLPSGLSGSQATSTQSLPPDEELVFSHTNFVARELGQSSYEARPAANGEGDELDGFEVIA